MKGKRPGILVVHEWWGHNEHARDRARMLAEDGYTALAVDMYGNGKTANLRHTGHHSGSPASSFSITSEFQFIIRKIERIYRKQSGIQFNEAIRIDQMTKPFLRAYGKMIITYGTNLLDRKIQI